MEFIVGKLCGLETSGNVFFYYFPFEEFRENVFFFLIDANLEGGGVSTDFKIQK